MKKSILLVVAALVALASCTDKIVEAPAPAALGFENPFINKAVKSTGNDLTNQNLTMFKVWGYVNALDGQLFNGQKVTGAYGDATWSYSPLRYWVDGGNYYFTALAQYPLDAQGDFTAAAVTTDVTKPGTINFVADGDTDIAYDFVKRESANGVIDKSVVPFTFKHLLSRIKFSAENTTGENDLIDFVVKDIKVANVATTGTCTLSDDTAVKVSWAKDANSPVATLSCGDVNGGQKLTYGQTKDAASHKFILALPLSEYGHLDVTATVEVYEANQLIKTVTATSTIANVQGGAFEFVPGYSYNFICQLNATNMELNPIEFTLESVEEYEEWTGGWTTTDQVTIQ